jgi:hypothetical protein
MVLPISLCTKDEKSNWLDGRGLVKWVVQISTENRWIFSCFLKRATHFKSKYQNNASSHNMKPAIVREYRFSITRRKERDWNCAAKEILAEWNETEAGELTMLLLLLVK